MFILPPREVYHTANHTVTIKFVKRLQAVCFQEISLFVFFFFFYLSVCKTGERGTRGLSTCLFSCWTQHAALLIKIERDVF